MSTRTITPAKAIELQKKFRSRVIRKTTFSAVNTVAGINVSVRAAIVVMTFPDLEHIETSIAVKLVSFPYVPGLLAFREVPVILDACAGLEKTSDLVIVDGQGYAHPRGFGVTCHVGVELNLPAIGCAKSRLIGE